MNPKDTFLNDMQFQKLVNDENYYKYIFKKTEKIVTVVFYILNNIDSDKKTEVHVSNIAGKAHLVHEHSLRTLEIKRSSSREVLEQFAQALIALESTFRVSAATPLIAPDVLRVVSAEIDTVLRGLRGYIHEDGTTVPNHLFADEPSRRVERRSTQRRVSMAPQTVGIEGGQKSDVGSAGGNDRRDRIKTIIEAKGEATIKDISEIVTDVSEKTIQRELQTMIEDNIIKRQGERRWSRYSLL